MADTRTRFTVPMNVVLTAETPEQAEEIATAFALGIIPRYKPFSATFPSTIGKASTFNVGALLPDADLTVVEAEAFDALLKDAGIDPEG